MRRAESSSDSSASTALDRATASPAELLAEVRGLLQEAEAWVRVEGGDAADEAVIRLREALAQTCRAGLSGLRSGLNDERETGHCGRSRADDVVPNHIG